MVPSCCSSVQRRGKAAIKTTASAAIRTNHAVPIGVSNRMDWLVSQSISVNGPPIMAAISAANPRPDKVIAVTDQKVSAHRSESTCPSGLSSCRKA